MTISMYNNSGATGNVKLPAPSGAIVALTNGCCQVNPADVPSAMRAGWVVGPGQNWPGAAVQHLQIPANSNFPANGNITLPDGTTLAIAGGVAVIPRMFAQYYIGFGFFPDPVMSALDL